MRQVFENYLAAIQMPMVVSIGRTDVLLDSFNGEQFRQFLHYAADRCQRCKLIFETPQEAVKRYQSTLASRGYGRYAAARYALSTCFSRFVEKTVHSAPVPIPVPAPDPIPVVNDPALLRRQLTAERSLTRTLTLALQKLQDRLTEIETSRLWQWRRRLLKLRWLFVRASAGMGGGLWSAVAGTIEPPRPPVVAPCRQAGGQENLPLARRRGRRNRASRRRGAISAPGNACRHL